MRSKNTTVLSWVVVLSSMVLSWGARVASADSVEGLVELPLERLFVPENGFDDNDRVEVAVHGVLPNGCYKLADSAARRSDDGKIFTVEQYAIKSQDGVCAPGATLPPAMAFEIPFTQVIQVGQLKAGTYHLHYGTIREGIQMRNLNIAHAPAPTPDTLPYAAVTTLVVSDIFSAGSEVKVTLTGLLNSTCTDLAKNVLVQKSKDVIVLLPTLKTNEEETCRPAQRPFAKIVDLGKLPVGQYLVHVRSMDGSALSHVIQVGETVTQ